jgi:hypothetical protein
MAATFTLKKICGRCKGSGLVWTSSLGFSVPALEADPPTKVDTDNIEWTKSTCAECEDGEQDAGTFKLKKIEDKLDEILAKLA